MASASRICSTVSMSLLASAVADALLTGKVRIMTGATTYVDIDFTDAGFNTYDIRLSLMRTSPKRWKHCPCRLKSAQARQHEVID